MRSKQCLINQLKENGGIGSISEQLLDTRADVTIGGGSKYFRQTVQGGEYEGKTVWEQAKEMGFQTVENDPAAMNALRVQGRPASARPDERRQHAHQVQPVQGHRSRIQLRTPTRPCAPRTPTGSATRAPRSRT